VALPKSELPQGTLDLLILKAIVVGPLHGYAIAQRLEQVSRGGVKVPEGSLYPALHRLQNRGFLAHQWKKTETGRDAKFYSLTRKGQAQLEKETASWERLTTAVGLILRLSEGGSK
jgi:PadR family transcriptional regulator